MKMKRLTFAECELMTKRKLRGNTYLECLNMDTFGIRFHKTIIVRIHRDGTYTLNSGGWRTVTTKWRINGYSPARVTQMNFEWYCGRYVFFDGIKVDSDGFVLNADSHLKVG